MATKKKTDNQQRIRIKLKAYDNKIIDKSAAQIVETIERYGGQPIGPVPLPTEIQKYTVNRSSFIDKNSREQFEMRTHKRLIDILASTPKIIHALMNLNLPREGDIQFERVSELMKKAEVIPDSHWNEEELRKAAEALTEVANFLEGNVGSEN